MQTAPDYVMSNCNNISDILDWMWFLHDFGLQKFMEQQT